MAAILPFLLKAGTIVSAVGSGIAAYQSLTEGRGAPPVSGTGARPQGSALTLVPQTRSEMLRRRAAVQQYARPRYEPEPRGRRRMNVLNPRALRRSIARVKGFTKFAMRVGSYTRPGQQYRLKGFAKRRTHGHRVTSTR